MHLCGSSSNAPRLPSFLEMLQNPHVLLTFDKVHNPLRLPRDMTSERPKVVWTRRYFKHFRLAACFAPQRRALFQHLNFQKCSEPGVLCAFWLGNALRATTAEPQITGKLDDGWPESVEEQGLLLLVWRRNFRNDIWKMCYNRQSRRGVSRQNSEKCKTIVCIANTFTHRRFYTQKLLHTEAFTHRSFYTDAFTHKAFTHRSFYIQKLLHTEAFTHRRFYTDTFTHRHVYTQTLLHTDPFTHRSCFYTQTLVHTQKLLHIDAFTHRHFYTQTLLHTNTFTHRRFYTQTLLRRDAFTQRRFYAQKLLHSDAFTHKHF